MDKLKHLKQQYVSVVKKGLTGDYDDEIFPNRQDFGIATTVLNKKKVVFSCTRLSINPILLN